jgi:hypothetical protein
MTVLQLIEHLGTHIKQITLVHAIRYAWPINIIYRIPVNAFLFEETIVLVYCRPQGLKIADSIVIPFVNAMTS